MAASKPTSSFFRRHLLASVCCGVAAVIGGVYALRFGLLDEAQQLHVQTQGEAEALHRNLHNAAELPEHLGTLRNGLVRLEEKLMRSGDVAAYQEYFFKLEKDSDVKIVRLLPTGSTKITATKQPLAYRPMGFDLTVEGAFANVVRFLRNLESGSKHYRLVSFSVRKGTGAGGGPLGQSNFVTLVMGLELLGSQ